MRFVDLHVLTSRCGPECSDLCHCATRTGHDLCTVCLKTGPLQLIWH